MSSDTESTVSSTSSSEIRRKAHKKLKSKTEKKSKKHKKEKKKKSRKEKKRPRRESTSSAEGQRVNKLNPIAPPRSKDNINAGEDNVDLFGPALPPHLLNKSTTENNVARGGLVIGPTMPDDIEKYSQLEDELSTPAELPNINKPPEDEEDLRESYGPLPIAKESDMSAQQIELEKRALELKMAAIDGCSTENVDQKVREEWMLELPEVGLKTGLAALNNLKRGFHQGKEKPDFNDR